MAPLRFAVIGSQSRTRRARRCTARPTRPSDSLIRTRSSGRARPTLPRAWRRSAEETSPGSTLPFAQASRARPGGHRRRLPHALPEQRIRSCAAMGGSSPPTPTCRRWLWSSCGSRARRALRRRKSAIVLRLGRRSSRRPVTALASELGVGRIVIERALRRAGAGESASRRDDERARLLEEKRFPSSSPNRWSRRGARHRDLSAIVRDHELRNDGRRPERDRRRRDSFRVFPADAVALDAIYAPLEERRFSRATARGLRSDQGLGMLARRGALAFEHWLGVPRRTRIMLGAIAPK